MDRLENVENYFYHRTEDGGIYILYFNFIIIRDHEYRPRASCYENIFPLLFATHCSFAIEHSSIQFGHMKICRANI